MPVPPVSFAPSPNNHVHPHSDMESDDELKENIKRRIQEVFSSMFKSAHQKGVFSDEHEAKFLEWLHAVVEEIYRAELTREHQGQHKKDDYHTALLKEKQRLTDRIQRIDNIISGLAAAFPDDLVPSSSNYTGLLRPSGCIPASTHKPKPTPNALSNQPPSHDMQWQGNERRRVRETSNFRAIGEAIRQIESNRQRQWNDWTHGRTTPPLPIVKEQEDILNRITRAAVSPPVRNNPSAPSRAMPNNKPLVSGAPDGRQPGEGAGGKYPSHREEWTHNAWSTHAWPPTPPVESTQYSTSCLRCKPDKSRDEGTASAGYAGYGNSVEKPSYEIWYPPTSMEEAGTAPGARRGYMYARPGNTEVKGKGKLSLR